jgi:hypothetical protein
MEGHLSYLISSESWQLLDALFQTLPEQEKARLQKRRDRLNAHFRSESLQDHMTHLDLFYNLHDLLQEMNIPTAVHCKSSTDRTGMGIERMFAMKHYKELGFTVTDDIKELIEDERFKILVAYHLDAWHQRTRHSRDVLGRSYGPPSAINSNPMMVTSLPEAYLIDKKKPIEHGARKGFDRVVRPLAILVYYTFAFISCLARSPLSYWQLTKEKRPFKDLIIALKGTLKEYFNPIMLPTRIMDEQGELLKTRQLRTPSKFLSPLAKEKERIQKKDPPLAEATTPELFSE